MNLFWMISVFVLFIISGQTIYADAAVPWQVDFQDPASPVAESIIDLHHRIMFYLILIAIFVGWMLARTLYHFNESKNKVPSTLSHASTLEVIWTVTPSFILLFIALPSFDLLYAMDEVIDPALTVKVIGHQWYWSYEYSDYSSDDQESIAFDSYMVPEDELETGQYRLLEVDEKVVIPVNTHVRFIVTSSDVLHCWAVPSLGIKMDAVPGRLNQTSTLAQREGVYYGQCSEICGVNHGFMPIAVEAVSLESYLAWVSNKIELTDEIIKAL